MHDFFRRVTVSETTYELIRRGPEALRHRLDHLIAAAAHFYLDGRVPPSARIRHLDEGLYKVRVDRSRRIPFHFSYEDGDPILHFGDIGSHDAGVAWHTVAPSLDVAGAVVLRDEPVEVEYAEALPAHPGSWIGRVWDPRWDERARRNPDAALALALDPWQRHVAAQPGPLLLRGGPGSGKTTIAVYRLLMGQAAAAGRQLYVTYTDTLRAYAEQQYDALAEPGSPKPRFLAIPDLCRELIGPDAATRFPPERRMTAALFRSRIGSRSHRATGPDPDLVWEEIQAVIKGDPRLLQEPRPHLSRDEYLPCRHRIADDPDAVYRIFETYMRSGAWDDLDLSREAYWRQQQTGSQLGAYDEIVVDEAQDLTGFQIGLLLALCKYQTGLFLAGDTQQAIHPSRFDWTRSRELLYRLWDLRLPADHIWTLDTNYRNPASVVEVCNRIAQWRQATWQEEPADTKPLKDGPPIRLLTEYEVPMAPDPDLITSRLMVIVPDESAKEALQARYGAGLVFTVHEAKGLEREYVLVWRPFAADRSRWDACQYDDPQFVTMVNRLVVSLSRATKALFLVDDRIPTRWPPLAGLPAETGEAATSALREVFALEPDSEPFVRRQASSLEGSQHYEQAAALYERIRDWRSAARCHRALQRHGEAARCLGWAGAHHEAAALLAGQGRWMEAALHYQQAGDHAQAAEGYLRADAVREAIPHLLAVGRLAEAARCHERLGNWAEAARIHEALDRPAEAAHCHSEQGDWAAAAAAYGRAGKTGEQALCLEMAGHLDEAAQAYERLGDWSGVGRCREALGETDAALKAYDRGGAWWESGQLLSRLGRFREAARSFAKGDDPLLVAAAHYQYGQMAVAARHLELSAARAFASAGEVAQRPAGAGLLRTFADLGSKPLRDLSQHGMAAAWQAAAILYERAHDKAAAARCRQCHDWASRRDWGALAEHWAAAGMPEVAAGYLARAGRWAEAAAQWETAWDFPAAAAAYGTAGDEQAAVRCRKMAEADGPGAVAILYEQAGMWERAAQVHAKAENWKRAALAWYKLGLAGLQAHVDRLTDGGPLPETAIWTAHWDASVQGYQKARDTVNATRVKRLATLARTAATPEAWQALAKEAGAD